MPHIKKIFFSIFICSLLVLISLSIQPTATKASAFMSFVVLSDYKAAVDIGDEFYLFAVTSNGKLPSWKSSNSKVASVNTYGNVIAKKSGTATITAKIRGAEASCKVTVSKTKVAISQSNVSLERGGTLRLRAATSNGSIVTWKSSKKSIASIDESGYITGLKPGETTITATADGSNTICKITVKSPTIKLNKTKIKLYRCQTAKLIATVSSGIKPTWKSSKKSVALVDEYGTITALKNGSTTISATVDGVTKTCNVTVEKPIVTLSSTELSLKAGEVSTVTAKVSSGNAPIWSSSNSNVVTVNATGTISAIQKGTAYIYAAEDGVKVRCTIHVTK